MQIQRLPFSEDAERACLGVVLVDPAAVHELLQLISREDLYLESHRRIFDCIESLTKENVPVDLVTLCDELTWKGDLESVGGAAYLASLSDGLPRSVNLQYHAKIVKEKSALRRIINLSNGVVTRCLENDDPQELLAELQKGVIEISDGNEVGYFKSMEQVTRDNFDSLDAFFRGGGGAVSGLKTGFDQLDRMTFGLQPGSFVVIAGRTSQGKSSLLLNILSHIAMRQHKAVGLFSLEDSEESSWIRLVCSTALLSATKLRSGFLSNSDMPALTDAIEQLAKSPFFIDASSTLSVPQMNAKARRLKQKHNIGAFAVDYLQLMYSGTKTKTEQEEVSAISRSLKQLAKDLGVVVIGVSQLNRLPEMRGKDNRPRLSDLRSSGQIENDADLVMFVYRQEMYGKTVENEGKAELIIAKQRNGPIGKIPLTFIKEFTTFSTPEYSDSSRQPTSEPS